MTSTHTHRTGRIVALLALLLSMTGLTARAVDAPAAARAERAARATVAETALNVSALQPGRKATAAVVFDIRPGFHAQSHTPTADFLIPFVVKPDAPAAALTLGEPVYPPGKLIPFPEPKQLSVYEGRVVIQIPIEVKADATLGPVKITGSCRLQICDDTTCYAPERLPFSIDATIVGAGEAVQPNKPELFQAPPPPPGTGAGAATANPAVLNAPLTTAELLGKFGLAFLVGIVFNAVPCVLPVLPLKALGFYEVSQHNRARSLAFGATFSLGVIASFAVLGLLVVVLKVFAWGELFSNPWFAGVLALILVVMAFNMFGLFTVNLPTGVYAFSPRHDTYLGNFLFGILTAALSTPCTFGLFVSILATALTQTAPVGMLLICMVGAGMASPYMLLSAAPELARRFPRTGPWAEVVKQFMGFLLLAVAVFFAQGWVGRVIGRHNTWWVIYAILVAGGAFLVVKGRRYAKTSVGFGVVLAVALLLVVPTFFVARLLTAQPYKWQEYSADALAAARSSHQVVLVDFTADWCANCHTVEALVLNRGRVMLDVQKYGVVMVRADLSDQTAPGWALLRELKGEGIPLTVVYSSTLPEPIRLAGLYQIDDLRGALAKAAEDKPVTPGSGVETTAR